MLVLRSGFSPHNQWPMLPRGSEEIVVMSLPQTYFVYEVPLNAHQVPELQQLISLGARPGSLIYVGPADRLEIHITYPAGVVPVILDAADHLRLLRMSPPLSSHSPAEALRLAVGFPENHQPAPDHVQAEPWPDG